MGLDQYAYAAARAGQLDEYHDNCEYIQTESGEYQEVLKTPVVKPIDIAVWRKHPNLHGWVEALWIKQGRPLSPPYNDGSIDMYNLKFNGVEVELKWEDLDQLESDIVNKRLPLTEGFFFGENSDEFYYDQDLKFIRDARAHLFLGLRIFYNSSW